MPGKIEGGGPMRSASQKQRGQSKTDWRLVTPSLMPPFMSFPLHSVACTLNERPGSTSGLILNLRENISESMPRCSVCGREFPESKLVRCCDCGKAYCPKCADDDPTIGKLGVCPDCEEVFEAEEDYWDWE